jgi:hypothetical protein
MYAENALPIVNEKNKALFIRTLTARLDDFEKETKRKRVEKVLKKTTGNDVGICEADLLNVVKKSLLRLISTGSYVKP